MPPFGVGTPYTYLDDYAPVKRPKEIACFSFDDDHNLRLDDSGVKYYYTPKIGVNLSDGFETFRKLDDERDDHLDALLKSLLEKEKKDGVRVEANVVTWRGMMTKILVACEKFGDGFEMNATCFQGTIFIEEDHYFKLRDHVGVRIPPPNIGVAPDDVMTYWGYKFETLSTLPAPWAETTRDFIKNREHAVVDNHAQYCSVVATGVGDVSMILAGEVDAIWDEKPADPSSSPINWVELKTMVLPDLPREAMKLERRLHKWWAQSFMLGVPKIVVGYRSNDKHGTLLNVQTFETTRIPAIVMQQGRGSWNHKASIGFMRRFLEFIKDVVTEGGVWKIRRDSGKAPIISITKVEAEGTGDILSKEFLSWRRELAACEEETREYQRRVAAAMTAY